jgi:hypothetical protein
MLIANRRHRLLFIALAGMDVAWSLPYALIFVARWQAQTQVLPRADALNALTIFIFCWAVILSYMLAGDWLNRRTFGSPLREVLIFALVLITSLLGERLLVYRNAPLWDVTWLVDSATAIIDFTEGIRPALVIFAYNLFLWWRVALLSGRDLAFFSVGLSFRLGMLLALLGNGLLGAFGHQPSQTLVTLLWLFFACGLIAVALARMDDKAILADNSSGALLPWRRFGQLLLAVVAVLSASVLGSAIYSPAGFRRLFGWLSPVTDLLGQGILVLLLGLLRLLTPFFNWLDALIARWRAQMPPPTPPPDQGLQFADVEYVSFSQLIRDWALLRYCLVTLAVIIALALIWLFFMRTLQAMRRDEAEEERPDDEISNSVGGGRRLGRLRSLLDLLRRYGLSQALLAAISVKNIYANVSRLASKRGFARPPAMSPDVYLRLLGQAFPGQEERLTRLTLAYMRVHYGDEPVAQDELAQLQEDYAQLRSTDAPPQSAR